ncbi:MAG: GNAT family N-acetyltransferase [Anaerolineales bacterium]|nr:GNAT family N-acetyltransferase [Anaerolineales bacterium]
MATTSSQSTAMEFHPLTPDRWEDFERLLGKRGAYGGCWCMWWRLKRREFEAQQGNGNKQAMKDIVKSGVVPGILLYRDGEPAGWCSVAPREQYGALERSPVLRRVDDAPVWSIVCFFVGKDHRNQGVARQLIRAAIEYVRSQGGKVIEAYPTQPRTERLPPISSFMGVPSLYAKEGFVEVSRPSPSRVIMRYHFE